MNKNTIDKEKLKSNISKEFNMVWLRWVFLIIITPLYVLFFDRQIGLPFILVIIFTFVYNVFNHYLLVKRVYPEKWFGYNIYIDLSLISALIAFDGGYSSSIFICYYIFIVYEGVKRNIKHPISLSLGAIIIYTAIVYLSDDHSGSLIQIIFRDIFILISGLFLSDVLNQFTRYDKLHKREYDLARKDKLTGLFNKNALEKMLNEELLACIKDNRSLCVLMFDVDNFKLFNDVYGQLTGDDFLRFFSKIILESISSDNKAFRYEGEEFLIMLKDTELKDAYKVAEIIRKKVSGSNIYIKTEQERQKITVSCAVACCPEHAIGYYELLEYVDKALHEAKTEGKNKVVIAEKEI